MIKRISMLIILSLALSCFLSTAYAIPIGREPTELLLNEPVSIPDVCDFTLVDACFTPKVEPSDKSGYYSYYEADEGKVYFYMKFEYTNYETESVSIDGLLSDDLIEADLLYANKYEYDGFIVVEENYGFGATLTTPLFSFIDPLCTETIYCLISVPEVVQNSEDSLSVTIEINNTDYLYIFR